MRGQGLPLWVFALPGLAFLIFGLAIIEAHWVTRAVVLFVYVGWVVWMLQRKERKR